MIYDVRTYVCRPGTIQAHLAIYAEHGFEVQKRHLGEPLTYLQTETGDINSFMHVWGYRDAQDREQKRAAMHADPQWAAYRKRSGEAGYLVSQNNQLMIPVSFFTPK